MGLGVGTIMERDKREAEIQEMIEIHTAYCKTHGNHQRCRNGLDCITCAITTLYDNGCRLIRGEAAKENKI